MARGWTLRATEFNPLPNTCDEVKRMLSYHFLATSIVAFIAIVVVAVDVTIAVVVLALVPVKS